MSISTNAFRFLALRPVQTVDRDREALRFLRVPDSAEPLTTFQGVIYRADTRVEAREAATALITSDRYLRDATTDLDAGPFVLLHAVLVEAVRSGDLGPLRRAVRDAPADGDVRDRVGNRVWDCLIAAFLAPRVLPHDREVFVAVLRVLRLLPDAGAVESIDDLRDLVTATAVIPAWVWKDVEGTSKGDAGLPGQSPKGPDVSQDLSRDISEIDDARADVGRAQGEAVRDRTPSGTPSPRAADPDAGSDQGARPRLASNGPSRPWAADVRVGDRVAAGTTALLDRIDPGWRSRPVAEVQERLARRRDLLARRVRRIAAAAAAAGPDFTGTIAGSVGTVRPTGYGDLLVIQDTLTEYGEGEVAFVENVMRTESKQRVYRRLDKSVQQTFTSTDRTEESERDLQNTERYELASEASETFSSEMSISTGVDISGSYGPVLEVAASADFSVDTSTETSQTTSSTFAQDIVDRTVSRISTRVREEVTTKLITETEEVSTHGFDNTAGAEHAVGIYRWLDKTYQAQVLNYGKRLMIEMIPAEPSAFYRYAREHALSTYPSLTAPEPLEEDFGYEDITPANYDTWVDRYRVSGVEPPPPLTKVVGKILELPETAHGKDSTDYQLMTRSDSITVPTGYTATEAWTRVLVEFWGGRPYYALKIVVGGQMIDKLVDPFDDVTLDGEVDQLPIGVITYEVQACVLTVEALCTRTADLLDAWKLATYQKIVEAYNAQQSAYDAAVSALQTSQDSGLAGLSPDAKRVIEQTELKRACLQLLTNQYFHDFNATVEDAEPFGYPEFVVRRAMDEAPYIQFFEQFAEWSALTYLFYPYFWGRKSGWVANSGQTDSDPTFEAFLRAGAARVLVPIRPGYEKAVCHYLKTGEIWNGGGVPLYDDDLFVSIVDEIAQAQDVSLSDAVPYGEPWTYRMPTTLVALQADATLPTFPLPELPSDPPDPRPSQPS